MSDGLLAVVALAALLGAALPTDVPVPVLIGLAVVVPFSLRHVVVVAVAVGVICSGLAGTAWRDLAFDPGASGDGVALVVVDPERRGAATSAVIEVDGRRFVASGWGAVGFTLGQSRAGDHLLVTGTVGEYGGSRERRAALGASHRLSLHSVVLADRGAWHWRIANGFRSLVDRGAQSLPPSQRSLFVGLVYGDDREQDPLVAADFRSAGLTHLLAVSGQNVAYVLTLLAPLAAMLGRRARWLLLVAALGLFATATRFEPSVLRATAMAGLALTSRLAGRETTPTRSLSLAVIGLLLFKPLLATTVAFRLSVAASAGIAVLTPRIVEAMSGPRWLREPLGVTVGAQLAVAPVLVTTFGPVSLVTVPANLLAGPAAGLAMMWGMTAGAVAGLVGGQGAEVLHLPTRGLLWWLEIVARRSADSQLPSVGLLWLTTACGVALLRVHGPRRLRPGLVILCGALVVAALPQTSTPVLVGWDSVLLRDERTVLVVGRELSAVALIADLRGAGVAAIDVAVVTDDRALGTVALARGRVPIGQIWSAGTTGISTSVTAARSLIIGTHTLLVEPVGDGLAVVLVRGPPA